MQKKNRKDFDKKKVNFNIIIIITEINVKET